MGRIKHYLLENFENLFVLTTLLSTAVVNHFVPAKLAFLNFYFLPIILAGYYLGRRSAVLGALLCSLMIAIYVVLFPEAFKTGGASRDVYTHIAAWAGFLILAGAVVGRLQEKLADEVRTTGVLNAELRPARAGPHGHEPDPQGLRRGAGGPGPRAHGRAGGSPSAPSRR